MEFASATLDELLAPEGQACACGRRHETTLRILKVGGGVVETLPETLRALQKSHPFVVMDENTKAAAGERVEALLRMAGIAYTPYVFPETADKLEPDEHAVGALTMSFDPRCDIVLAVGSGVVNDCCKVLARAVGRPQMVVGTAPSMDGYASNSSSMVRNKVKETLYNACPQAILCDTDIMRMAPMPMLHAGLGDMLAKYISVAEWRISNLIIGENYCENIASLVRRSLKECLDAAPGLLNRDQEAVGAVARGLVLSGVAMSYAESSRPASGLEHYFSHMWEMMALERGKPSDLHGIQVGVGSLLTFKILDRVRKITPSREKAQAAMGLFSQAAWEKQMHHVFGKTAPEIIRAEKMRYHKNDPVGHAKRLDAILANWPKIINILDEELPETAQIERMMRQLSMPMHPSDLGISREDTKLAFIGSRDIRDKYLTSSMLWDLGLFDEFADFVHAL